MFNVINLKMKWQNKDDDSIEVEYRVHRRQRKERYRYARKIQRRAAKLIFGLRSSYTAVG